MGDKVKEQPDTNFGGPPPPSYSQFAEPPGPPSALQGGAGAVIYQPGFQATVTPAVGPKPTSLVCRACNQQIVTRVEHMTTTKTHIIAALLCVFFCWPCACAVYCMDSCKNAGHYCPKCHAYIGTYSR